MALIDRIASEAGVSKWTVARVLNGNADYRRPSYARRAEEIRQIASRMGYRPNAAARATASGRCGTAVIVDAVYSSSPPSGLVAGASSELHEQGTFLGLVAAGRPCGAADGIVDLLPRLAVDGAIVLWGKPLPSIVVEAAERYRLPMVWSGHPQPSDSVHADHEEAISEAVRRLVELGHRQVAYVATPLRPSGLNHDQVEKRRGYDTAMLAAGLTPRHVDISHVGDYAAGTCVQDTRLDELRPLLESSDRPSAVIAESFSEAGPVFVAAQQIGLSVPGDLSIMTTHSRYENTLGLPMTSMHLSYTEMGRQLSRMLLKKIEAPSLSIPSVAVRCRLFPGATCAPPSTR